MIDLIAAIDSVKFSSKSELSSRFFGRLKFSVRFEYLGLMIDVDVDFDFDGDVDVDVQVLPFPSPLGCRPFLFV